MSDAEKLKAIAKLHRPVQYRGYHKVLQMIGRNPLAYMGKWCITCRTTFPCATAKILNSD